MNEKMKEELERNEIREKSGTYQKESEMVVLVRM